MTTSTISNNTSGHRGGGIANVCEARVCGTLTMTGSTVGTNTATAGGGILNDSNTLVSPPARGTLTITNNRVIDNTASNGNGGGIMNGGGTMTLTDSFVSRNTASMNGGRITNTGTLTLTGSTVSHNTSTDGGGIYNVGSLTQTNSTVSGITASDGAGIYNRGTVTNTARTISDADGSSQGESENPGTARIINSTISGNSATGHGGGIYNASDGAVTITHDTITGHFAASGGGIHNLGALTVTNTIAANSTSGRDCFDDGTITDGGHNLVEDASCGFVNGVNGNIAGLDPMLDELRDNGGPTLTHALLSGSPAIDAGNAAACEDEELNNQDQRGFDRQAGAGCDIGAFELDLPEPICGDANLDGRVDVTDVIVVLQIIVGMITPSPAHLSLSDVNQDGTLSVLDALMVLSGVVGDAPLPDTCAGGD